MAVVVGFVAAVAAIALLLAWFVAREVAAIAKRADWHGSRLIAVTAGAFVLCAFAVFYAVIAVLVVVLR